MTLDRFIAELQGIADNNDPTEIEVVVEGWNDNFYDGDKVDGIRLTHNRDFEKNEIKTVMFIITGDGR